MLLSMKAIPVFLWWSLSLTTLVWSAPTCTDFTMPVAASAMLTASPVEIDPANPLTLLSAVGLGLFDHLVSGTFTIAGVYCEPENYVASRSNTLQLLVHGVTYTRSYWFGQGQGDRYSWALYASQQGYPTLSVDRIGNGLSQHPDPLFVAQAPLEIEILHQMILAARAGQLPPTPRAFRNIIYIGHSFGSCVGNGLNVQYPDDVNGTILTGYTAAYATSLVAAVVLAGLAPASISRPVAYANLSLGYLAVNNEPGFNELFYAPNGYDPAVAHNDFLNRGTVAVAEAVTIFFGTALANRYTRPVYVMTAQNDGIFCSILGVRSALLGISGCDSTVIPYIQSTKSLYPNASSFGSYILPTAGHCWNLCYDALAGFTNAHVWMASHGF